jgi:hypothetical protein
MAMDRRRMLAASVATMLAGSSRYGVAAGSADVLARYVVADPDGANRVDYGRWKATPADRAGLHAAIVHLEQLQPSRMARPERFAYWCNLYNAVTVRTVVDAYPVASIKDIKSDSFLDYKAYLGPWRTKRVTVEGQSYSLDDMEHSALRPVFADPRVHYALNCASIGCPNLLARVWTPATLDADLDTAARAFINHPRGVAITGNGRLRVSSIYKWFEDDFAKAGGVLKHLRMYAGPELARVLDAGATVQDDQYDWRLNDVRRVGSAP